MYKRADRAAPAIPALLNHLSDEGAIYDCELRVTVAEEAANALTAIGEAALPPAVQRLQDSHSEMRTAAARLLGRMGGSDAVPPPIAALQDPESEVRKAAVEEVAEVVRSDDYPASTRRWALAAMKGDALEPELALLSLADRACDLRLLAADRLSDLRPPGMADRVFEILEELDDEAYLETVRELASYLGFTKDQRATIPLVAALHDAANRQSGYFMMPRSMIVVFGELNDPRAVDRLLEMTDDPSRDVRLAAINWTAPLQRSHVRTKPCCAGT